MALPDTWSKQSERLRWSSERGWELVQIWQGPSGAAKATRDLWLAEQAGYTALEFEDSLPTDTGDAVCQATITFAADQNGTVVPDTDPDYGLLSRSWSLVGSDEQLAVEANPNVVALQDFSEDWPIQIRAYVEQYKKRQKEAIEEWGFTENTSPAFDTWNLPAPTGASAGLIANAEAYASLLLLSDNPVYETSRYVLKKTETVTSWSTLVVSHTNVNRWHSWSSLVSAEPTLSATGLIQTAGLTGLIWLKKTPEVVNASRGNYELTQEYWGGIYPESGTMALVQLQFLYGAVL